MNTKKRRRNNYSLLVTLLFCLISACTSAPVKSVAAPMCSGIAPTQKYVWTISLYQGVPKGMELARVSQFVQNHSELQDRVIDSAIGAFVYLSSDDRKLSNGPLQDYANYLASERSAALIETGASNFLFCAWGDCTGLKDPVTHAIVKSAEDNRRYSNLQLRKMYYVEGIVDPDDMKFDTHRRSSYGYPSPAYVEWNDYFDRHPFPGGNFLTENYFSIPESKKKELCISAGYDEDCYEIPKFDFHNKYILPKACKVKQSECEYEFSFEAPFRYKFLLSRNGLGGLFDSINHLLTDLNKDPFLKKEWENVITKDIFLTLSKSITRKVEKDWIITRIEWNPTLFCQYARPTSELFSK